MISVRIVNYKLYFNMSIERVFSVALVDSQTDVYTELLNPKLKFNKQ